MDMATVDRMSKHEKHVRRLAPVLWIGGILLLGIVITWIAMAEPADPLDRPNVVPGGSTPADFQERLVVAQVTSRDQDRLDRYREQLREERREARKQERKEQRQAERREQRQAERQEAREAAAAEQQEATSVPSSSGGSSASSSGGLPSLLLFIRSHESGGNYQAYNASGCEGYGCGGAYQLHARYAPTWAARAGYPGMGSNAATWPPATQDAVALHLFYSTNPDGAHWCNWVSYC